MLDGIINALAGYYRTETRREEKENFNSYFTHPESGMTISPELQAVMEITMPDGRLVIEHVLEAQKIYEDLDAHGRAS